MEVALGTLGIPIFSSIPTERGSVEVKEMRIKVTRVLTLKIPFQIKIKTAKLSSMNQLNGHLG